MKEALRVLVLAGTGDALAIADRLAALPGVVPITSFAGRVARPRVPKGEIRIGGFGGVEGLERYLASERIDVVLDATHPFAATISRSAATACGRLAIPLRALLRPRWHPVAGDRWHDVGDMTAAAALAHELGRRIFLTIGRQELLPFAEYGDRWFLIRTIEPPEVSLPAQHELLLQRGPFALAAELQLVREHSIDLIVSKNSGGAAAYAKLAAARALGVPVVMVRRPERPSVPTLESVDAAVRWIDGLRSEQHSMTRAGGWCG